MTCLATRKEATDRVCLFLLSTFPGLWHSHRSVLLAAKTMVLLLLCVCCSRISKAAFAHLGAA